MQFEGHQEAIAQQNDLMTQILDLQLNMQTKAIDVSSYELVFNRVVHTLPALPPQDGVAQLRKCLVQLQRRNAIADSAEMPVRPPTGRGEVPGSVTASSQSAAAHKRLLERQAQNPLNPSLRAGPAKPSSGSEDEEGSEQSEADQNTCQRKTREKTKKRAGRIRDFAFELIKDAIRERRPLNQITAQSIGIAYERADADSDKTTRTRATNIFLNQYLCLDSIKRAATQDDITLCPVLTGRQKHPSIADALSSMQIRQPHGSCQPLPGIMS